MSWRGLLAAALLATAGTVGAEPLPTGSPSAPGYTPIGRDERGLWDQAAEAERDLKTSRLVLRDPALNTYLRGVLCRTVGESRCGAARIYVLRSPAFNAYMMPNGAIVINTGLFLRVQDEAELAAVLGHEFTHFEHRHSLYDLRSRRSAMSWGIWLTVASFGGGNGYDYTPGFAAGHFSYARDQERDADLTGLGYMRAGGFRPSRASDIWAQMREEEDRRADSLGVKSGTKSLLSPFADHPMDAERMTYLRAAAAKEGDTISYTGGDEYRAAIGPLWPMLIADQIKLNDFGGSEYLLTMLAGPRWTGPLLYAQAELYRTRGGPADLLRAVNAYREAGLAPDAPAETWRGLGLTYARLGQPADARGAITEYLKRRPDAGDRAMLETIGVTQ